MEEREIWVESGCKMEEGEGNDAFPSPIAMMTESSRVPEDVMDEKPSPVRDQSSYMLLDNPVETMNSSSSSYGSLHTQTIRFEIEDWVLVRFATI